MSDQTAQWWYEHDGQQAGPISAGMLESLLQSGQVRGSSRVWRAGMAGWEPAARVPELAPHLAAAPPRVAVPPPPAAPPPLGEGAEASGFQRPSAYAPPAGPAASPHDAPTFGGPGGAFGARPQPALPGSGWAQPAAHGVEEIPFGTLVLLTIVTFGIYGVVKFYQTVKAYEGLAGRESKFTLFFWLHVGLSAFAPVLNMGTGVLGIPFGLAGLVFGILTLFEALKVRDEALRRRQLNVAVTTNTTHKVLYVLGVALMFVLVGAILLVVQGVMWFQDWNVVAGALRAQRA
jgi:hypothetical protein